MSLLDREVDSCIRCARISHVIRLTVFDAGFFGYDPYTGTPLVCATAEYRIAAGFTYQGADRGSVVNDRRGDAEVGTAHRQSTNLALGVEAAYHGELSRVRAMQLGRRLDRHHRRVTALLTVDTRYHRFTSTIHGTSYMLPATLSLTW